VYPPAQTFSLGNFITKLERDRERVAQNAQQQLIRLEGAIEALKYYEAAEETERVMWETLDEIMGWRCKKR